MSQNLNANIKKYMTIGKVFSSFTIVAVVEFYVVIHLKVIRLRTQLPFFISISVFVVVLLYTKLFIKNPNFLRIL